MKSPNPIALQFYTKHDPIEGLFTLLGVCQNNTAGLEASAMMFEESEPDVPQRDPHSTAMNSTARAFELSDLVDSDDEQMDGAARIPKKKTKDTDATMSDDDRPTVVKKENKVVLQSPF